MHPALSGPRIFYGWILVAVACTIVGLGMGLMLALGVFVEPLETTFGWGRGAIGQGILYGWILYGVSSLLFGALADRLGLRRLVIVGSLMCALGLFGLSRMQTLWQFYLIHGLLVGGGTGAFLVPLTALVTRWFRRSRGLVVAIVNSGAGLGSMVFGRASRSLLLVTDWRMTLLLYALLVLVVVLPLALLVRDHPRDLGLEPYGGEEPESGDGASQDAGFGAVLRTQAFWLIAIMHTLCCMAHSGPLFHMVSNMLDHHIDPLAAATIFSLAGLASIPGRIGTGLLAERYGSQVMLVVWLASQAVVIGLYRLVETPLSFTLLSLWFGISYGSVMPLYAVVTREFFGPRVMGTSYGAIFLLSCAGMGLGAWVGGRLFDQAGTYQLMYLLGFGASAVGAICAVFLRRPQPLSPALAAV